MITYLTIGMTVSMMGIVELHARDQLWRLERPNIVFGALVMALLWPVAVIAVAVEWWRER